MVPVKHKTSCYNCTKRRIRCDQSRPHCLKCTAKGLDCPGYGIRYRFAPATSAPPPLPPSSTSSSSPSSHQLFWVDDAFPSSSSPSSSSPSSSYSSSSSSSSSLPSSSSSSDSSVNITTTTTPKETQLMTTAPPTTIPDQIPMSIVLTPLLANPDSKVRFLFHHFVTFVSPTMVMYDDQSNGYRHAIMPLAHQNPLVSRAMCIAAAFHLSAQRPELKLVAEHGRAAIIQRLSELAMQDCPDLSTITWTTIILLIVAELVTGHEHIVPLHRMLMAFVTARGQKAPTGPLEEFLLHQSKLISFFAYPFLREDDSQAVANFYSILHGSLWGVVQDGAQSPDRRLHHLITDTTLARPWRADDRTQLYQTALRLTTEMYLLRARASQSTNTIDTQLRIQIRLQKCRQLFAEVGDMASPGAHTMVWPAFVAAAESTSEDDRLYFLSVLKQIWQFTRYGNVERGIEALPGIWDAQGKRDWTSVLSNVKTVVM